MLRIAGKSSFQETLAKIIFLLLPTFFLCYFLLWNANEYYAVILKNQAFRQALYVGCGMLLSALIYHFRFRFLPVFALLVLTLYLIYQGIDKLSFGEFDTFFHEVQFLIFAVTFVAGWLIGWGFTQLRYFSVFISAVFLLLCVVLLSRQNELFFVFNKHAGVREYALLFGPAVLYCIYIIFTAELIYSYRSFRGFVWWSLVKRLVGFIVLAVLLLVGVIYFQRNSIKETLANFGGGGKEGKNGLLQKNKDNTFDLRKQMQLRGSFGRTNELLFAAHINHFFPNSKVPNPLYMTAFYYSRFDTATQTFEEDPNIPDNDLFKPNPALIPLFSTRTDSSVLKDALKEQFRSTVDVEVYKIALSPKSFVAPSLAFFVQPVTVEKDFRGKFKSAYRAKSYISELNSAYFVYNAPNPEIRQFQEQRFQLLRQVKNYRGVDEKLMAYYTKMPPGEQFERIRKLADSIEKGKILPVDKVLAIRDYFLAKDANGKPIYSYTDNPGIPDIPNASRLKYFLFQSHKGYCAYYAGATLFLLRAMGIPSRIAVGFMTVDRSSNNPGWYWFYADQAHAWVQVFFPGFGWLDFDTTVGNSDARQSPAPDGTPPMQPPKAFFAADGKILRVDTLHKKAELQFQKFVFHDKDYELPRPVTITMDLSIASIQKDSVYIELKAVHDGDSATAVSYAEVFRDLHSSKNESAEKLVNSFPKPAPVDELHVKKPTLNQKNITPNQLTVSQATNWKELFFWLAGIVTFILLFFLSFPWWAFQYFKLRISVTRNPEKKSFWIFRAAAYYLHLVYAPKGEQTYLQYAQNADVLFEIGFASFMKIYLKLKYAHQHLSQEESAALTNYWRPLIMQMHRKIPFGKRFKAFFKVFRAIGFWGILDK